MNQNLLGTLACVAWCITIPLCLYLLFSGLRRSRKEFPTMAKKASIDKALTPDPVRLPFVTDTPRDYTIMNRRQGKLVRSVGRTYHDALATLNWRDEECVATDHGPASRGPFIVDYYAGKPWEVEPPQAPDQTGKE